MAAVILARLASPALAVAPIIEPSLLRSGDATAVGDHGPPAVSAPQHAPGQGENPVADFRDGAVALYAPPSRVHRRAFETGAREVHRHTYPGLRAGGLADALAVRHPAYSYAPVVAHAVGPLRAELGDNVGGDQPLKLVDLVRTVHVVQDHLPDRATAPRRAASGCRDVVGVERPRRRPDSMSGGDHREDAQHYRHGERVRLVAYVLSATVPDVLESEPGFGRRSQ